MVARVSLVLVSVFLFLNIAVSVRAQQSATVSLKDIENAWQKRESLIHSAEYRCDESEFIGAFSVPVIKIGKRKSNDMAPNMAHDMTPEKDIELSRQFTFAISGSMMQYSYDGNSFYPDEGIAAKKKYVSVCDGTVAKNFHDNSIPGQDHPMSGFIPKAPLHWDHRNQVLLPILMFARPLQKTLGGIDITQYSVSANKGFVEGRECILIESKQPRLNGPRNILWLDAQHGFVVRRQETKFGSRDNPPNSTIDIEYQSHAQFGLVPVKWKRLLNGGNVQETVTVIQSSFNTSIEDDRFRFEYPKGTAVVDMRTGERFIASSDSGERRTVTNAELQRGASYKELSTTPSGEARGKLALSNNWWFRGMLLLVLLTFLSVVIGNVWKRKFRVCAIFLSLFLVMEFTGSVHAQHATASIKDIESAWQKRESLIRSIEYSWEETELIPAHSKRQILTNAEKRIPEKDLEMSRQRSIELSGKMARHSYEGDFFNPQDGTSSKKKYVSVCDGLVAKNFHDSVGPMDFPKSGFIYKEARNFDITIYPLLPVLMFARPLQKLLGGIDLDEYAISPSSGYCDGRECILLESKIPTPGNGKLVYWIDSGRNFIVRRFEEKCSATTLFPL